MVGDNIIKQSTGTVKKFIVFSYSSVNSVTCNNEQGVEVNFSRINNSLQMPNQSATIIDGGLFTNIRFAFPCNDRKIIKGDGSR